jgi:hypothetical protein
MSGVSPQSGHGFIGSPVVHYQSGCFKASRRILSAIRSISVFGILKLTLMLPCLMVSVANGPTRDQVNRQLGVFSGVAVRGDFVRIIDPFPLRLTGARFKKEPLYQLLLAILQNVFCNEYDLW